MTDTPTTSVERLLPCPFCGGEARREDIPAEDNGDLNAGGSCISCTKCFACTAVHFGTKENLVNDWNRRPHPVPKDGWLPIAHADKSIATVQTVEVGLTIRNSHPVWVRDEDGRVYEAVWTDHRGGYWWDLAGENQGNPVEFMPHPVDPRYLHPHPVPSQGDRDVLQVLQDVQRFITNGVELGYIRMPDSETPDPAHTVLPKVEAAIAKLRAIAKAEATPSDAAEREELAGKAETLAQWFDVQNPTDKMLGKDEVQQDLRRIATLLRNQSPAVGEEELAIALWREEPPNPDTALNWDYESPKRQETFRSWARRILSRLTTEQAEERVMGGSLTFHKEHCGATVATLIDSEDVVVEILARSDGDYELIVHNREGERDTFRDCSAVLRPKHWAALGELAHRLTTEQRGNG